jgi:DNA primase
MTAFIDAADDQALLEEVVEFYHRRLREKPNALAWLKQHAITMETVERFRLGLADRTLGLSLPEKNRKAGAHVRARLQRLGILRASGHEHLAGALVVPVLDAQRAVVQMYGRLIGASLRAGTKRDVFLPNLMRGVWNAENLSAPEVILCSGLIDALTVWSAGLRNVTVAFDRDHLREHVLPVLKQHGVEAVLVAYPNDERGDGTAARAGEVLQASGIAIARVVLPAGFDANTLARKRGPEALVEAVHQVEGNVMSVAKTVQPPAPEAEHPAPVVRPPAPLDFTASTALDVADEVAIILGDRRYRVRGLARNTSHATLKVNILVTRATGQSGQSLFHADTFDLYQARQRAAFIKHAAHELGLREEAVKRDVGQVLLRLEDLQEEFIRRAMEPKRNEVVLSETDRAAAMGLLQDPRLVERVVEDFQRCGVVGEQTNLLVAYLAAVSRKLEDPLAVIVQSSSAAGKTSLVEAVLDFIPPEDRLQFSALTGQALYYLGQTDLQHRVLSIAEEEGAERAVYALKLLQSEGELTIASTGKEASTGRLVAQQYTVRGPVMLFLTTTATSVDEELLNRCLVLTVNEDRDQTRAIHRLQRERQTLQGVLARRGRDAIVKLHRDAQRLLRPLLVANPYAPDLTFLDDRTRTRRDHTKYLALIRAVALLHQYQRDVKAIEHGGEVVEYVEVTAEDIALANRLAHQVLGRSLDDVPPHTRSLLGLLHEMVAAACHAQGVERTDYRFTRKMVREATGWGDTQLKVHLRRLVELEYLAAHRNGHGAAYELLYDGQGHDGERFLTGLIDAERLQRSGSGGERSGSGRPSVGPWSAGGRGAQNGEKPSQEATLAASGRDSAVNSTSRAPASSSASYTQAGER